MNIYAGMFGTVLLRDNHEQSLGLSDRLLTAGARLYYPVSGNKNAPWMPEVLGDAMTATAAAVPAAAARGCGYSRRRINSSFGK